MSRRGYRRYRGNRKHRGRRGYQRRSRQPGLRQLGSQAARTASRSAVQVTGGVAGGITYVAGRAIGGFLRGIIRR
jgi:hypothetical protein